MNKSPEQTPKQQRIFSLRKSCTPFTTNVSAQLSKSMVFATQSLNMKCQHHSHYLYDVQYVCLHKDCDKDYRLCCARCLAGHHQDHIKYIVKIQDFLKSENEEELAFQVENWPTEQDSAEIKQFILDEEKYLSELSLKIDTFFNNLQEKMLNEICQIKAKLKADINAYYSRGEGKQKIDYLQLLKRGYLNCYDLKDFQKNLKELINREIQYDVFASKVEYYLKNRETQEKINQLKAVYTNNKYNEIRQLRAKIQTGELEDLKVFVLDNLSKFYKAIIPNVKKDYQSKIPCSKDQPQTWNTLFHDYLNFMKEKYKNLGKNASKDLIEYKVVNYADGSKYEGFLVNGERGILGTRFYKEENTYVGEYQNSMRHGKGIMYYFKGTIYEGDWSNDQKNGMGKEIYTNGSKFEGEFLNDQKHGKGKYTYPDGKIYEGEYRLDKRHGQGILYYPNKKIEKLLYNNGTKIEELQQ